VGQATQRPEGSSIKAQFEQALIRARNSVNSTPDTFQATGRGTTNGGGNAIVIIIYLHLDGAAGSGHRARQALLARRRSDFAEKSLCAQGTLRHETTVGFFEAVL
jgi:hypothetical protein